MMHTRHGSRSKIAALATTLGFLLSGEAISQTKPPKNLDATNSIVIATQIEPELQEFVSRQSRMPGQANQVLLKVHPDPNTGVIWIDLDSGYLPKGSTGLSEGLTGRVKEIENEGYELINGVVGFKYIRVRIDGKTLSELYPSEYGRKKAPATSDINLNINSVQGLVVLNPGHGKYLNHEDETWRYQRPTQYAGTTDIYEDTVTPGYSSYLASMLTSRSSATVTSVKHTRDIGNTAIDPESGLAWSVLGARYYLKHLYPTLGATIWNKFPTGSPNRSEPSRSRLREYDEDIRARPEYANYINAETMISLHTDAADATARGATIYTNVNDTDSFDLATSIHCYLTEQITQVPAYSTYTIRSGVRPGDDYGEVRVANMTTALIEVGFHTNTEDSALLRNSSFRSAAMRGIEKGYRMHKEGKPCTPFAITNIPNVTGPSNGTLIPANIQFEGFPRFPVTRTMKNTNCPSGANCPSVTQVFNNESESPLLANFTCTGFTETKTGTFSTKLKDADGVETKPYEHTLTCTPTPAADGVQRISQKMSDGA